MIVIVPSRGRPHKMKELIEAFERNRTDAELVVAIDHDDPTRYDYHTAFKYSPTWAGLTETSYDGETSMIKTLNHVAVTLASQLPDEVIGFMGDDHRPRTYAWDAFLTTMAKDGIAYANDTVQGPNLPTQVFMPARFVNALGHMAPSVLFHLYADNYWKTLGERAMCLSYLHEVVIEHLHPTAGKAEWDDGYVRVNAGAVYQRDHDAYVKYIGDGLMDVDANKIRGVRSGV